MRKGMVRVEYNHQRDSARFVELWKTFYGYDKPRTPEEIVRDGWQVINMPLTSIVGSRTFRTVSCDFFQYAKTHIPLTIISDKEYSDAEVSIDQNRQRLAPDPEG